MRPKALLALIALLLMHTAPAARADDWPIVVRRGDALLENGRPFRFIGLTAPNIQAHESQILPDFSNRFPDDFETRDILETLHRLGSRATRTFSLSVASPEDGAMPAYITGRGRYNEDAFRCLDRVIALCHDYDVRLIIPFIASQSFAKVRGVDEFSALSGKPKGSFWYDDAVKADFRDFLTHVLNRRNTVNGIAYKDDPAILAWQLGNEFASYYGDRRLDPNVWIPRITQWSLEMAAYIKKIDPNHLVMEAGGDRAAFLASPDIDVMSSHLYEYWNRQSGQSTDLAALARAERAQCLGKKPLIVDEFGLATVANNRALMEAIRTEGITGGLLWSLRCHRRDGGFMVHNEGGTSVNSYHYPGFGAGHDYQETELLDLVRAEAFAIRGLAVPRERPPGPAPVLLRTADGFTWRGSTGASFYAIERSLGADGPWEVRATGLQDSVVGNAREIEESADPRPVTLWTDAYQEPHGSYFYRIRGFNASGPTDYSPIVSVAAP